MLGKLVYFLKRNNRLKDTLKLIIAFLHFPIVVAAFITSYLYRDKGTVWLISEMGIDAKDNGRDFFEYLRAKHPEIPTAYVLDRGAREYSELNTIGTIVQPKSFQHYIMLFRAKYLISTHDHYVLPMNATNWREFKILYGWLAPGLRFVFLQHGIEQWDAEENSKFSRTKFDFFVTSTRAETEEISHYGYPEGTIIETGMPRLDKLKIGKPIQAMKHIILFSPTWRQYLADVDRETFLESTYFKKVNGVLTDEKLHSILTENNAELYFMPPHHEIQAFLNEFSDESNTIRLVSVDEYSLKKVLMESSLMITDYSSISMDFAFMERPVIYYQFDQKEFAQGHYKYKERYFTHERDGFGPIVTEIDELISSVNQVVLNNYKMTEFYKKRADKFFTLKDTQNADRLFAVLKEHVND